MLQMRGQWGPIRQCEMDIAPNPSELSWGYTGEHDQSPTKRICGKKFCVTQVYLVKLNCVKGEALMQRRAPVCDWQMVRYLRH